MLGHHRHANEKPFKWRFAGGPMMVRLQWYLDPPSSQLKKKKKKKKKTLSNLTIIKFDQSICITGYISLHVMVNKLDSTSTKGSHEPTHLKWYVPYLG